MTQRTPTHLVPMAAFLLLVCVISALSFSFVVEAKANGDGGSKIKAQNVILLIGDGMGFNQLTAARWEKAGEDLETYRTTSLALDQLEYSGYVTTSCANSFITYSAPAATAIMAGV